MTPNLPELEPKFWMLSLTRPDAPFDKGTFKGFRLQEKFWAIRYIDALANPRTTVHATDKGGLGVDARRADRRWS